MKLIRIDRVLELTGVSRSEHYIQLKRGLMTPPVHLGAQAVAWPEREIMAINTARISGKNDDEIRQLVVKLTEDRKSLNTEVVA